MAKGYRFSMDDVEALDHWRRIERHGVPRSSPGSERKRGQGENSTMAPRYLSGIGRMGEKEGQLRVRSRVIALVRAASDAYGQPWDSLPFGGKAWSCGASASHSVSRVYLGKGGEGGVY